MLQKLISKIQLCYNVRGTKFLELWVPLKCDDCKEKVYTVHLNSLNSDLDVVCMNCWNEKYED